MTPIDISLKCHHWSAWKYDDYLKRNHPFGYSKRLRGYRVNAPRFVAAKNFNLLYADKTEEISGSESGVVWRFISSIASSPLTSCLKIFSVS